MIYMDINNYEIRLTRHVLLQTHRRRIDGEVLERDVSDGQGFKAGDELVIDAAGQPLIGAGGIVKAVGNDPGSAREIGRYKLIDVVEPGGCEQHSLRAGTPWLGSTLQDERPHGLGLWRAARFACAHRFNGMAAQACEQALDLG